MVLIVPLEEAVKTGENFTVKVLIVNVEELSVYEFTLGWNPEVLKIISVVGGGFISPEGASVASIISEDYLYVGDCANRVPGAVSSSESGTGFLAEITL